MDLPDDFNSTSLLNWAEEGSGSGGRASAANATAPGPLMNDASSLPLSLSMFSANGNGKDSHTTREGRSLLHIGHHPLAMTSLASCPPYPAVATLGGAGAGDNCGNDAKCDVGSSNVQQQQQQQLCLSASSQQQQQQAATASSSIMFINNYINSYRNQNNTNSTSNNNNFFTSVEPTTNDGSTVDNVGANANNNFAMPTTGYDFSSVNNNNNIINFNNSNATSPYISNAMAVAAVVAANTASTSSQHQATQFANHLRELRSNFQDSYATMPPPSMSLPMPMQMLLQQQLQHHTQQQQHHYGITVNGFHPQVNAQTNHVALLSIPLLMATTTAATSRVGGHQPQQKQQTGTTDTASVCAMASSATPCSTNYQIHHPVTAPGGNANIGSSCATRTTTATTEAASCSFGNGFTSEVSSFSDLNTLTLLNRNNPEVALNGVYINNNCTSISNNMNNNCSSIGSRPTSSITAMSVAATSTDMSYNTAVHSRNSRDRNEREQVRAKKITQLITELRDNMQGGGWREEMKSKYQVLSQCRDYMEHLKRAHQAKEADIERTKKLYEEQQRRWQQQQQVTALVDDLPEKDPESETSSVSDSTALCTSYGLPELNEEEGCSSSGGASRVEDGQQDDKMRVANKQNARKRKREYQHVASRHAKNVPEQLVESLSNEASCKSYLARGGGEQGRGVRRVFGEDHNMSSTDTSSMSEDDNEENLGGKDISFHKESSTLSDMTDSNQSGTDGGSGGGANASSNDEGDVSTSSISSTAAVVLGLESSQNTELMGRRRRVQSRHNTTSVKEVSDSTGRNVEKEAGTTNHTKKRRGFRYDYKEVFLKSNVPQLIATLSGRIVVWNEFFLRATGLSEREAKRLTIFSIVQPSELSNLYKMVARALAEKSDTSTSATTVDTGGNSSGTEEWQAITLKCIPFPNDPILCITVALMKDVNRDQRCFHCILTDCPGSNGRLGSVTPELFAKLFIPNGTETKFVGVVAK